MNKKVALAAVCTIVVLGIGISVLQNMQISEKYSQVFTVDATFYPDKKIIEITYDDSTQKTKRVVLEILGMQTSFQKIFDSSSFVAQVPFDSVPQYGWRSMPVTLAVEHDEFGKIGIKTDVHNNGEPSSSLIFSRS
ncbi:hypothetical protein [Candidatus Nitrosotenuis cloacae]|uniref:hypothetical protein n=1 Tax=Candidatus Nitrosotenuis cloacae TaxID=1603555 RepID=UPI0022826815|nr:hypothetical protein [Candidatus Nitrosotenuis cloacae]